MLADEFADELAEALGLWATGVGAWLGTADCALARSATEVDVASSGASYRPPQNGGVLRKLVLHILARAAADEGTSFEADIGAPLTGS